MGKRENSKKKIARRKKEKKGKRDLLSPPFLS
jgi:hypothetical protein